MSKTTNILKRKGFNIIISAPSGVGKSTLINKLLEDDENLSYSISATTRRKREGEVPGKSYHFKSTEEFYTLIKQNAFLEYAEVFGNFYGTLEEDVISMLDKGLDILFDIDWQGASVIKNKMPGDTIGIFILPPSIEELEKRIRGRGLDKEDTILYRMAKSRSEITHSFQYEYIVINDDLEQALSEIKSIILANRLKREKFINLETFIKSL